MEHRTPRQLHATYYFEKNGENRAENSPEVVRSLKQASKSKRGTKKRKTR